MYLKIADMLYFESDFDYEDCYNFLLYKNGKMNFQLKISDKCVTNGFKKIILIQILQEIIGLLMLWNMKYYNRKGKILQKTNKKKSIWNIGSMIYSLRDNRLYLQLYTNLFRHGCI